MLGKSIEAPQLCTVVREADNQRDLCNGFDQ